MSAGGLSRRRVAASSSQADEDGDAWGLDGGAPQHAPSPSLSSNNISHAGSAFEGGSKIAYDPKDLIDQGEEDARQGGKAPRLTIMEEVLLLGLKDRQVRIARCYTRPDGLRSWSLFFFQCFLLLGILVVLER